MDALSGPISAVIFDLDDTLTAEINYIRSGFRVVAGKLAQSGKGSNDIYEMLCKAFEVGPKNRVFNTVLNDLGLSDDPQIIAELVSQYRCHRPAIQLDDLVKNTLITLKKHFKLGLITDGFLPAQRLKVEALDIEGLFDAIIYTEELGRQHWKPDSRAFIEIADTLGCPAKQCVYIGDNISKDFVAPNKLGWQSVMIKRPSQIHNQVEAAENGYPTTTIRSIDELLPLLSLG